jgi:hypothetical protein
MADYTQITREAPYLEDFRRRLLQGAFDLTQKQGAPTTQRGIAALDPFQTGAMQRYGTLLGVDPTTGLPTGTGAQFDPYFTKGLASLDAATQQYDPSTSNYQQFQNQYQADVTAEALKQMDVEAQKAQNQLAGDATLGGTFGGSRYGIQQAELAGNLQDIKSRRIFQDLAQNFEQAQQKAIGTYESGRGRQLQASPLYGGMGAQQFGLNQAGIGALSQLGDFRRQTQQQLLNEQFRMAEANRMSPYQRLSYFSDVMQGVPSVSQTLTQKPLPYTNPILGGIGMGLGAYGLMQGQEVPAGVMPGP